MPDPRALRLPARGCDAVARGIADQPEFDLQHLQRVEHTAKKQDAKAAGEGEVERGPR